MKTLREAHRLMAFATCLALSLTTQHLHGATNTWTGGNGSWQDGTKWSLGAPPSGNDQIDLITNAGVQTIVIDAITSHIYPSTMGINSLTLSAPNGTNGLNTLSLNDAGNATPLKITNNLTVGAGGALYLSNSALSFPAPGVSTLYDDGQVTLSNSWIYATNAYPLIFIANSPGNTNGSLVLNGGGIYGFYVAVGQGAGAKGSLTIDDGLLSFPFFATNLVIGSSGSAGGTCAMNGGQIQANVTTIGAGAPGTLCMQGGSFSSSLLTIGYAPGGTGVVSVLGGQLVATNLSVGFYNGDGTLIVGSNGVVTAKQLLIATNDPYTSYSHGTLIVQPGGTLNVGSSLLAGTATGSTGQVNVIGGTLTVTNGVVQIGHAGRGQMNISGGHTIVADLKLGGSTPGAEGVLQLTGGHLTVLSNLSANFIIVGCGDLDGSGGTVIIGEDHDGNMQIVCGTATNIATLFVGYTPGYHGTFTQDGGLVTVHANAVVGQCAGVGAPGTMTLNGGDCYVTNAAHTAVLDVRNGTLQLNSGATLMVDILMVTNANGHILKGGGVLVAGSKVLSPSLDADGDGLPNGWEQGHSLDPLSASGDDGPLGDPDHDGQSNLAEYRAGTDPQSRDSVFRMLGATVAGQDVQVSWTTVGGHSYVVQVCANATGSVSASFVDCSGVINVGGGGEGTRSYTHVGGATNRGAYYRVRLGP